MTNSQEIAALFLIASITGVIVSFCVNIFIRSSPVLVVQLSMLITLFLYPAINGYLFVLFSSDYESVLYGKMSYLSYNSAMFFAPLPACVLVAVIFSFIRKNKEKKIEGIAEPSANTIKTTILKKAAWIMSVIMGGLWFISIAGKMTDSSGEERLIMLLAFTIYGIAASLVAWIAFWSGKWLS